MAKYSATLTAQDTNTQVCMVHKKRSLTVWSATVQIYTNTSWSGTVTLYLSTDGGTTKVAMMDIGGNPITATANTNFNIQVGNGNTNSNAPIIYAGIGAATNPNVTIDILDNN